MLKTLEKCWEERLLAHAPSATLHNDGKNMQCWSNSKIFQVLHNIIQIYKTRCRRKCSTDPMVYKMYENIIQINTRLSWRTLREYFLNLTRVVWIHSGVNSSTYLTTGASGGAILEKTECFTRKKRVAE